MKKLLLLKSLFLLCALIVGTSAWADDYERITSTSDLEAGKEYILVCEGQNKAMGAVNSYGASVSVEITSNKITATSTLNILTLGGETGAWTFYTSKESKYLTWSSSNTLNVGSTAATNADKWTISFDGNNAIINNKGTSDRKLRFNAANPRFACYTSAQTQVQLYKKIEVAGAATTVAINSTGITNTNKFVSTAAGTLTATVKVTATSAAVDGATVTWSSSNTSVATVGENTGIVTLVGEGTTTITASYAGVAETYKSSSADYVLTVTDEDPNAVTLWSENFSTSGYSDRSSAYGYTTTNSSGVQASDNYAGGVAPEMMVKAGGTFSATIPLENILGNLKLVFKTNAKGITVSTTTDGVSISGTSEFSTKEEHTVTFTGITTSMTSIVIVFTAGSDNVRLDDILLKGSKVVPVTISSTSGFATLYTPYAIDFSSLSSELKAYTASVAGSTVTLTEVDDIPANTGVVLKGDVKTHNIPVINSSSTAQGDLTGNTSAATAYNAFSGYDLYMLALNGAGKAQFTLVNADEIAAGKAFLKLAHADARELNVVFADDETTGVADVRSKMTDGRNDFYNLNGQKVLNPTKGLYIVNGKKYVIK